MIIGCRPTLSSLERIRTVRHICGMIRHMQGLYCSACLLQPEIGGGGGRETGLEMNFEIRPNFHFKQNFL